MWQKLIETLNELNKAYRELIGLSERKQAALARLDLKSLEAMNDEEGQLASRIQKLEQTRQKALIDLAAHNRSIKKDTRLKELISLAPTPQHQMLLRKLYEALDASTKEAKELADNNRLLIEGALSAVSYHLNRLSGTKVEPTYGRGGQEVLSHAKRLDFDA